MAGFLLEPPAMLNFVTRALSESEGNPSTMHLATLVIVMVTMAGWLTTTVKSGTLKPFTPEHVALVLGAMTVTVYQRGKEGTAEKPLTM